MGKTGRMYAKAVFTGYKRGQRNQRENTSLLQMEGCANKDAARYLSSVLNFDVIKEIQNRYPSVCFCLPFFFS